MPGRIEPPEFVTIGRILKPHGVKGAIRVQPLTDDPERFSLLHRVFLTRDEVTRTPFTVSRVQRSNRYIILSFEGIISVEEADQWREAYIEIPRNECLPLPAGSFYYFELIGLDVHTEQGERVGEIEDIFSTPASDIYVVRDGDREVLIPAVQEFVVRIDPEEGVVVISPIEGLLEL